MKSCTLLLIAVASIYSGGCNVPSNANNSTISNVNNAPTPSTTPSPTMTPIVEPAATPRPDEAQQNDQERFEGTAGITDKKLRTENTVTLATIRTAQHPGYDRIVFEFSGASLPGYHIEYIDKPVRSCGSGEVVPLAGDGWLEIRMTPAAAHYGQGQPTIKTRSFSPNLPMVKELKSTCDFEADVTWAVGVTSPNEYRVLELKDPARLVVDIKH